MGGTKSTQVKPASPSSQRSRSKQVSKASTAGSKVRSPAKPRKNLKEKPTPAKEKRDKSKLEAAGKRKMQQASGEAGTPKKKGKKRGQQETMPQKEATSAKKQQKSSKSASPAKKQQSSGKAAKSAAGAPMPAKKRQQSGKSASPAKRQQSSGKAARPSEQSGKSAAPAKKKQSSGKAENSAASETTPTKKQQQAPGGMGKSTPTKRKRDNAEPQTEVRSPKRASGEGDTAAAPTPVKKKQHKDKKVAAADLAACSFPVARVRHLMLAEDDTTRASSEAVFLVNKATELFLEKFANDAYRNALKDRKKSITYDNLSTVVCNQKCFKFLSDFVPQRLTAEDALKAAAANQSK